MCVAALVLILALPLVACGGSGGGGGTGAATEAAPAAAPTEAVTEAPTEMATEMATEAAGGAETGATGAMTETGAGAAAGAVASMLTGAFTAGTTKIEFGENGAFTLGNDTTGSYAWEGDELVFSGGTLCPDQEGRYTVSGDATAGFSLTAVDDACTARSDMLTGQGAFMMGGQ